MIAKVVRVLVPALFVYWFAGLLLSWPFSPGRVELRAALSAESETLLADVPSLLASVEGALEQIVGSPSAPGYLRPRAWIDSEWDPNRPDQPWPEDDGSLYADLGLEQYADVYGYEAEGSGEIGADAFRAIVAGNRSRHADAIAAIEAGPDETGSWPRPRFPEWNGALAEAYEGWAESQEAGEYEALVDFSTDMVALVETWYPRLSESAELYRRQCLHCHGVEGGGDGQTAEFLKPLPRDYRKGIFKFKAVPNSARPRREDLLKTLHDGLTGTAMPSFARFTAGELHGLVDYVRLLSIRGEVEGLLAQDAWDNFFALPMEATLDNYTLVWDRWLSAGENFVALDTTAPPATPETIARGREHYREKNDLGEFVNDCATCHGIDGKGTGASSFEDVSLAPGSGDDKDLGRYAIDVDLSGASSGVVSINGRRFEFDAASAGAVTIDLDPDSDDDDVFPVSVDFEGDAVGLRALTLNRSGDDWVVGQVSAKRAKLDDWGHPMAARDFTRGVFRAGRRPIDVYRRAYSGIGGTPMPDHSNYDPEVLWALVHYVRSLGSSDAPGH